MEVKEIYRNNCQIHRCKMTRQRGTQLHLPQIPTFASLGIFRYRNATIVSRKLETSIIKEKKVEP